MGVFKDLHVYLVEDSIEDTAKVKELLRSGEVYWEYYYTDLVDVVVCDREESIKELWHGGEGEGPPVVTSQWVILSHKCGAALPKEPFYLCKKGLFSGLTFCPSKLSRKDQDRLWGMVVLNGGRWQQRMDKSVTHLLTLDSSSPKYQWSKEHTSAVVVSPEWVLDCIEEDQLCSEDSYHPNVLSQEESDKPEKDTSNMDQSTSANAQLLASESESVDEKVVPDTPTDAKDTFDAQLDGTQLMVANSTVTPPPTSTPSTATTSETAVTSTTGVVGGTVEAEAVVEEKTRNGAKDSATEEAKGSAENDPPTHCDTVQASDSSSQPSTSSLPAHTGSKSDSGQAEGDKPVSSSSLLQGMVFYITDYNQSMDTTVIQKWKQVICEHGGEVLEEYDSHRCTHLIAKHCKSELFEQALEAEKCIATAYWLNDVLMEGKMFLPQSPLHFPTAFSDRPSHKPDTEFCLCWTNYAGSKRQMLKDAIKLIGFPYTGFLCKRTTHIICRKPDGVKYNSAKEWGVHILNAVFVTDILYEGCIPDVHPYHTDLQLEDDLEVNHPHCLLILAPWKAWLSDRSQILLGETFSRKRQQEHLDDPETAAKKVKVDDGSTKGGMVKAGHPPNTPHVMFTGFTVLLAKSLSQTVLRLGGCVVDSMEECTHLIAQKISRTVKFLTGVCSCRYILSKEWVIASVSAGRFVDESAFTMEDLAGEAAHGMKLATSLYRASWKKLLKGLCIYSTKSVIPEFTTLKKIVQTAGGELLTLEEVKQVYGPVLDMQSTMKNMAKPLVVICRDNDFEGGPSEEEMRMFVRARIPIYTPELVFTGILRQELLFGHCRITPPEQFMRRL